MIISVAGKPGSGKSTVARRLAARLGIDHVSAGDFMREMAADRGLSVHEFGAIAEGDSAIDRAIDDRSRVLGEQRDGFIIDARLAWYFIPRSIKVFLDVSIAVAADRIYGDRRGSEVENVDVEATRENIRTRMASESRRYDDYYGIDYLDLENYDIVVDTSDLTVDEVVDAVLGEIQSRFST